MFIKRIEEAKPYEAPNHRGVVGLRLQGFEAGGPTNQWVGFSQFLPGGGAGPDATPFEKVYVVLDGSLTVIASGREVELGPMDSCTIAPGEVREIINRSNVVCKLLVVIPYPPGVNPIPAAAPAITAAPVEAAAVPVAVAAAAPAPAPAVMPLPAIVSSAGTAGVSDPLAMFDVRGKVALITGASGAFGAVAARVLAGAGSNLMLAAGKQAELDAIAAECRERGTEVETRNLRPSSAENCAALVEAAVARFGRLDILVVASGKNDVSKITDMAPERFLDVMDANVTQSWLMARAATTQMLKQGTGGKIVLMSSARGLLGHPAGYTAYCASKSAVDGITKALGCELGPTGITVNAIAPTVFRSPLTEWMFGDDDKAKTVRGGFLARVPKGRLGEPDDLAGPLLFLTSKASDFYTGHILYADGGYTAG